MAATLDGANPTFAGDVNRLIKDHPNVTLQSGVRSTQEQAKLYADYQSGKGNLAAKPGTSNHEHGTAADIGGWQNIDDATLAQYGLHRPIKSEPWHVEPISASDKTPTTAAATAPTVTAAPSFATIGAQASGVGAQNSMVGAAASDVDGSLQPSAQQAMGAFTTTAVVPEVHTADGMDIDRFASAISGQESGGNYNSKNKDSGASGKYQIMPANWSSWATQAGLDPNAPQTPANQEKVARFKFNQYYQQFGNWHDVAVAWYAGPGAVGKSGSASQGSYPTINAYANQVVKRMNN